MNQFSIFKAKEHDGSEKMPTHIISAKIGDKYTKVGSCWTKEGQGGKFLSCTFDKPYKDKPGYHIEIDIPVVNHKTSLSEDFPQGLDLRDQTF